MLHSVTRVERLCGAFQSFDLVSAAVFRAVARVRSDGGGFGASMWRQGRGPEDEK